MLTKDTKVKVLVSYDKLKECTVKDLLENNFSFDQDDDGKEQDSD